MTLLDEQVLAFLHAYPHADTAEIAGTVTASFGAVHEAMQQLFARGYVKRSTRRLDGWLGILWMFDPDGPVHLEPHERGPIVDMTALRISGPFR